MNKTVSINIGGLVFHIEEDAYDRLRAYLDNLRYRFNAEEGRDEIMADIESRIAEILVEKKGPAREVIVMKDIEEVITMMGEPETISDESNTESQEKQEEPTHEHAYRHGRRRFFRDPDDRVVGGVCSGAGHYFDIDPVWIRLGFVLLFILGGTGILFYIILMIIIPKAETTAEKLEMRGDPVDVNNIKRTIQEEFEEFGNRMKNFGREAKDWGKAGYDNNRYRSRYHRRRAGAENIFRNLFQLIGRIFAFGLVFFGIIFLIGLLTGTFFVTDFGPDMWTYQVHSLFEDGSSYALGVAATLLFFGVPILMMIYYGIKVLFRVQRKDKWIGITAICVWLLGIVFGVISISNIAAGFSESSEISERVPALNAHDSLVSIRVKLDPEMMNDNFYSDWNRKYHYSHHWKIVSTDENTIKFGNAQLNIVPSTSDSIELIVYKKAHGRTKDEAQERVRAIGYDIRQDSSGFIFPVAFTIGDHQSFKMQEVQAELRIPVGTTVYIDQTCEDLIYDIANVSNTHDDDMVDRRWLMTTKGLQCVDCAGLRLDKDMPTKEEQDQRLLDSLTNQSFNQQ